MGCHPSNNIRERETSLSARGRFGGRRSRSPPQVSPLASRAHTPHTSHLSPQSVVSPSQTAHGPRTQPHFLLRGQHCCRSTHSAVSHPTQMRIWPCPCAPAADTLVWSVPRAPYLTISMHVHVLHVCMQHVNMHMLHMCVPCLCPFSKPFVACKAYIVYRGYLFSMSVFSLPPFGVYLLCGYHGFFINKGPSRAWRRVSQRADSEPPAGSSRFGRAAPSSGAI